VKKYITLLNKIVLVFGWIVIICYCADFIQDKIKHSPPLNPRDSMGFDSIYTKDSIYFFYKELDTVEVNNHLDADPREDPRR
jgi:hypothetical protein